jgi:hypothetical protein
VRIAIERMISAQRAGETDGYILTENCCCVSPATSSVRGASLTLGRLAISDPFRRYRGDVATGRRSLASFEGVVVTVWEMVGRASKNRNAQTLFDDM